MIIPFLTPLIEKIGGVADNLFTSDEERLKFQTELKKVEAEMEISMNEHMNTVVAAQRSILEKELDGGSWIAKNWRPILMIVFTLMIIFNFLLIPGLELFRTVFDFNFWIPQAQDIPSKVWTLLQIGLGGYILGRSGEKIADKINRR